MSTHLHSTEQTVLAVDAAELAEFLQVSLRHVNALNASGRLPKPVRLGRSERWPRAELEACLAIGAPSRDTWNAMRKGVQHG
ncbi:MAG: helix-turn-helix domain-containing protein [Planctomycetota bacterium]